MRPRTPLLTVDTVIRLDAANAPWQVVLIERRHPPPGWALPGGFVEVGERVEHAAAREAREETGLAVRLRLLLGLYSDPARDPRGHTVSAVYVADAQGQPQAADDARAVQCVDVRDRSLPLAFDHRLILDDYLTYLETGRVAPLRL